MSLISRRQFLQMAATLAAGLGWLKFKASGPTESAEPALRVPSVPEIADALETLATGQVAVLWLHGLACSGCSVSFLNAAFPDATVVLTRYLSLEFHNTVSAANGELTMRALHDRMTAGNYLLVVEGAVPAGLPQACDFGGERLTDLLPAAARNATAIIALGTCAAAGGVPAAPPNPTGAVSVAEFLGPTMSAPLIQLPGCPTHPDWLIGTLVYLLKVGQPALDAHNRPRLFYEAPIHARCPNFYDYNRGQFAAFFGEPGCLFKLGCLGPRTYADCSLRQWNNRVNWCIGAGAPCIGCARPEFAHDPAFPFYRLREQNG